MADDNTSIPTSAQQAVIAINKLNETMSAFNSDVIASSRMPGLTGDVTSAAGTVATTIASNAVTTAKILDANVTQAKLATNVAGTGPAFSVYGNTNQTGLTSGAYTKITLNIEEFDTNTNFDSTTNYRFTPTVAGYYQISCAAYIKGTNLTNSQCIIYKNNSAFKILTALVLTSTEVIISGSTLIYLSGAGDYLEFYGYATTSAGTYTITAGQSATWASGFLARAA